MEKILSLPYLNKMIYQPAEDSYILLKEVKRYAKNKIVLDMGSGSGIQALTAKEAGAKSVLATDIIPEPIKYLKKQNIPTIQSDLFQNIKGKFDLIIFNPPYLPYDKREDKESSLQTAGGKRGDEIIIRFLREVKYYLSKEGIVLIVISSLTPKTKIIKTLKQQKLKKTILSTNKFFMETLEVWRIQ